MFGNIGIQVKNYTSENVDNTVSQFDYTDDTAEVFLNSRM